ncbi:hypothetical protein NIES2104_02520 [Leptolyngbya sp. NIES-2104]|nr:hypothetical protein NIES2104_02520 [Leptolyngbya sp. NIES-2104]
MTLPPIVQFSAHPSWYLDMKQFSELELSEALFNAIAQALESCCHSGQLSTEEYLLMLDSVWFTLDFGTRLPR